MVDVPRLSVGLNNRISNRRKHEASHVHNDNNKLNQSGGRDEI